MKAAEMRDTIEKLEMELGLALGRNRGLENDLRYAQLTRDEAVARLCAVLQALELDPYTRAPAVRRYYLEWTRWDRRAATVGRWFVRNAVMLALLAGVALWCVTR